MPRRGGEIGALSKCSPSPQIPKNTLMLSSLCIRHRSFTSFDTSNNREADQGANSVHNLLIHNDQPSWRNEVMLYAGEREPR